MKWVARVIGLIAICVFLTLLVVEVILQGLFESPEPVNEIFYIVILLECLALAGIIISWWRERLAGILLAVACAGLTIRIVYAEDSHLLAWLIIGFPYLVASVLLLVSWRLSSQTS